VNILRSVNDELPAHEFKALRLHEYREWIGARIRANAIEPHPHRSRRTGYERCGSLGPPLESAFATRTHSNNLKSRLPNR
jgi:hypothetical protein